MFERFTERARRVIFFARYEASNYGSSEITCEHLLLGITREDKALSVSLLPKGLTTEEIASRLDLKPSGAKVSTSVDLPLSDSATRSLSYAAEESERIGHSVIGTVHVMLGLLREPSSVRKALADWGVLLDDVRKFAQSAPLPDIMAGTRLKSPPATPAHLTPDDKIIAALRASFRSIAARLTPDIEPAVVYSVKGDNL